MPLIQVKDIQFSYGDRTLLRWEGKFTVNDGDRVGIVGVNGTGKTTLMQLLCGEKQPDRGTVQIFTNYAFIKQQSENVLRPAEGENRSKWFVPLRGEGDLSGGELTRSKIAAALAVHAPLLFADEPTSHLDYEGTIQLQSALQNYAGAVVLISHDRELMDAVCNSILEVEEGEVTAYTGNYTAYQQQKALNFQRAQSEYEHYREEKSRLEQAARKKEEQARKQKKKPSRMSNKEARLGKAAAQDAQAKRIRSAKAVLSRVEHLDIKERPIVPEPVHFDVNFHIPISSKEILRVDGIQVIREGRALFAPVSFLIRPGTKAAILGPNGCGKTSLLESLRNGGEGIHTAPRCRIGYFDQKLEHLVPAESVLQTVSKYSVYPEFQLRNLLARLGFRKDAVFKPVSYLSGGERVKAGLAQLFFGEYNLLLLDEPTNYLDALTREQLEQVLAGYPGIILFATHDRRLVKSIASHTLQFNAGTFHYYEGIPANFTD